MESESKVEQLMKVGEWMKVKQGITDEQSMKV